MAVGHEERPEQIGVACDVLPRVVDEAMPVHEIPGIAKGDEAVVGQPGQPDGARDSEDDHRASKQR
jgi:hypothetical protein